MAPTSTDHLVHELVRDEELSAVVAQWLLLEAYRSGDSGPAAR